MAESHRREKRPDEVRRSLLDQAARIAAEQGLAAVTLQAVAQAASVTKGGLLHHFPGKQPLIEAVFTDLLARLDEEIDGLMAIDAQPYGRFTRAYVDAFFRETRDGEKSPWAAIGISCMADAGLRLLWSDWMRARLERHVGTDDAPALSVVRYAADGIWLANLTETAGLDADELDRLHDDLKRMTRPMDDHRHDDHPHQDNLHHDNPHDNNQHDTRTLR
ncbi:MAG: TetR/AcrR family transcriptional regulator [Neorhizobium sp.]|nr:TetR/AcrR family transcriptional regulator [Neorhizobium sp.]